MAMKTSVIAPRVFRKLFTPRVNSSNAHMVKKIRLAISREVFNPLLFVTRDMPLVRNQSIKGKFGNCPITILPSLSEQNSLNFGFNAIYID